MGLLVPDLGNLSLAMLSVAVSGLVEGTRGAWGKGVEPEGVLPLRALLAL